MGGLLFGFMKKYCGGYFFSRSYELEKYFSRQRFTPSRSLSFKGNGAGQGKAGLRGALRDF